ncbi:MAG: Glycosyl transferase group 1 [Candidatus Berkelbacteria bacterium Licking1014_85]|uniref:Glycosyl transferase group 1 n=1 Tax=Candidatus Berkelbacteria bacterium Licking1014_85 TaxID=2017148 RepID=A0A554LL79_9BACT|nr:MAG: Glycosyl transferase group 1 [Candidatus Berkelbacteria bacterium Licking1014_85]
MKKIKVAVIAPPFGETGGPEIVVKNLSETLVELGVDVTVFAPADWNIKCKHIVTLKKSLWKMKNFAQQTEFERRNLILESQLKVLFHQKNFDLIHLHNQRYAYLTGRFANLPCVLSMHSRIGKPDFEQIKKTKIFPVFLSQSQKGKFRGGLIIKNGIPIKKIKPSFKKGEYLIAVGRLSPQKGIDKAIKIALAANKKLLIFGRVGVSDERKDYFDKKIKPFLYKNSIIHKGEVSHQKLINYLKNAEALLFTIAEPEVCPLTIMESLACGTPVIGTKIGPLPELIENNARIALLSDNFRTLVNAAKNTDQFDRRLCRKFAEKYFGSEIMAKKYIELYKKILIK